MKSITIILIVFIFYIKSFTYCHDHHDESIDLIDPNCRCCGRTSGRYCGYTLNADCPNSQCSNDDIYYCFSTYDIAQRVRTCPTRSCLQISPGSSRCSNQ